MGCFNVACSVSSVSIGYGDEAYFLPLLPKNFYHGYYHRGNEKPHEIEAQRLLIYPDCYFYPFSLPIKGKYNDYGTLENIVRDKNVEAIEKFFGISIEKFMDCIGDGRSWTSRLSELFDAYVVNKKIMEDRSANLDNSFLEELGFEKQANGRFAFGGLSYEVELFEGEKIRYRIFDNKGSVVREGVWRDAKEYFLKDFREVTDYFLNVEKENQRRILILEKMSGMFIHADIYRDLADYDLKTEGNLAADYPSPITLQTLGFTLEDEQIEDKYGNKLSVLRKPGVSFEVRVGEYGTHIFQGSDDKASVYNLQSFKRAWEKLTGDMIALDELEKTSKYTLWQDEFRSEIEEYSSLRVKLEQMKKDGLSDSDEFMDLFIKVRELEPFGRESNSKFTSSFRDYRYFKSLYLNLISNGELTKEFSDWLAFSHSMYSANRFFFPAMNGEQHGNHRVSKTLFESSLRIVNKKLKDFDDDYEEDDEYEDVEV